MDLINYNKTIELAFAKHYAERSDIWTSDLSLRLFPSIIQGFLKLNAQAKVLDIGCGKGDDCLYFSTFVASVTGIDLIKIDEWDKISKHSGNVSFYKSSIYDFDTFNKFDLIIDNGCMHHQLETQLISYLSAVINLLGPDGAFALSTFKNNEKQDYYDINGRYHKYFLDESLETILLNAGFVSLHKQDIYRNRTNDYYRLWILCKK